MPKIKIQHHFVTAKPAAKPISVSQIFPFKKEICKRTDKDSQHLFLRFLTQNVEVQTNLPVLVTKEKPTLSRNRNRPANNSSTSTIQDHLQINRALITESSAKRRRHHTNETLTIYDSRAAK